MVKDPVLSLWWLGSLLWCRFDPWPGNFHMPQKKKKKKKKNKKKKEKVLSWPFFFSLILMLKRPRFVMLMKF